MISVTSAAERSHTSRESVKSVQVHSRSEDQTVHGQIVNMRNDEGPEQRPQGNKRLFVKEVNIIASPDFPREKKVSRAETII